MKPIHPFFYLARRATLFASLGLTGLSHAFSADLPVTGNLTATGYGLFGEGIDIGTPTNTRLQINWYGDSGMNQGLIDLQAPNGEFYFRDSLATGGSGRCKLLLASDNSLSLFDNAGQPGIVMNSNTGSIVLPSSGSNRGIFLGATPMLSVNQLGQVVFPATVNLANGLQITAGSLSVLSSTPSTNSTTGALVVGGGVGIGADSYINGVLVGRGGANDQFSTALGQYALLGVSTNPNLIGMYNTAVGYGSLRNNGHGFYNAAVGFETLTNNTTGDNNVAFGANALKQNTSGYGNTGLGVYSLFSNVVGSQNVAVGRNAMFAGTGITGNVAIGYDAMFNLATGGGNTAIGSNAGSVGKDSSGIVTSATSATNGVYIGNSVKTSPSLGTNGPTNEIVIGAQAIGLGSNTTVIGNYDTQQTYLAGTMHCRDAVIGEARVGMGPGVGIENIVVGHLALNANATGSGNSAFGESALYSNTSGSGNTALGKRSLVTGNGSYNTGVGIEALLNAPGSRNTAVGSYAGKNATSGEKNVFIGNWAGAQGIGNGSLTSVTGSVFVGSNSKGPATGIVENAIVIGHMATSLGSNTTVIGNYNTELTRLNGVVEAPAVKGLGEDPVTFKGKIVIEQPQGDISMGNYQ